VDGQDVRVLETRRDADLALKSLRTKRLGQFGVEHLERDRAIVTSVPSPIDRRHTAATDLPFDLVPVSETFTQPAELLRHSGVGEWTFHWGCGQPTLHERTELCNNSQASRLLRFLHCAAQFRRNVRIVVPMRRLDRLVPDPYGGRRSRIASNPGHQQLEAESICCFGLVARERVEVGESRPER
jgi:hypothetical protein